MATTRMTLKINGVAFYKQDEFLIKKERGFVFRYSGSCFSLRFRGKVRFDNNAMHHMSSL